MLSCRVDSLGKLLPSSQPCVQADRHKIAVHICAPVPTGAVILAFVAWPIVVPRPAGKHL